MKATNIEWDVDNKKDVDFLPTEIEIPEEIVDEEAISDYISEKTGFCHRGFSLDPDVQEEYGMEVLMRVILDKKLFGYSVDYYNGGKGIVCAKNKTEARLKIERVYMKKNYKKQDLKDIEVWEISKDLYDDELKVLEIFQ